MTQPSAETVVNELREKSFSEGQILLILPIFDAFARDREKAVWEETAKICDARADAYRSTHAPGWSATVHEAEQCAAAIRIRARLLHAGAKGDEGE